MPNPILLQPRAARPSAGPLPFLALVPGTLDPRPLRLARWSGDPQ
jgi:hypothetical protein